MSEDEFVAWCDEKTWAEWVEGEVIVMSPVNAEHAELFDFIYPIFSGFVKFHRLGVTRAEPYQVRLAAQRRRRAPDMFFVASHRTNILTKHHAEGPPDLVMEIVSPDRVARDWRQKYLEYESAGVREYWIIDPMYERVEAYALANDGRFRLIQEQDGVVRSTALSGFFLHPEWPWKRPLPVTFDVLRQLGVVMAS